MSLTPDDPETRMKASRDRASALVGQVISQRYRIDELIATGGMGTVYRGTHLLMHKRVAIKVLHHAMEDLSEGVKRFEREAIAGAHIHHPNVASATDFGHLDDGGYFLVLEYVKGRTLHEEIKAGVFSVGRAVHVARQIASGLEATHATGVVHRDVKPRNIILEGGQYDVAKLIDFGFAKVHRERLSTLELIKGKDDSRITKVGTVFGTIAYLAPEAALGMDAVDTRSDLYALGIIFFEMLTGRRPFESTEPAVLFHMHREAPIPSVNDYAPERVPPAVEAVIRKCLAKEPKERYQSAFELIDALDAASEAGNVEVVPTVPLAGGGPRSRRVPSIPPANERATNVETVPPPHEENDRATKLIGTPSSSVIATTSRSSPPPRMIAPRQPSKRGSGPIIGGALMMVAAVAAAVFFGMRERPKPNATTNDLAVTASATASASATATASAPATASATATATATATASASEPSTDGDGRSAFRGAVKARAWGAAADALLGLIAKDTAYFKEKDAIPNARETATALEREGEGHGEKLFAAFEKMGATGVDILYDIVQSRGGTRAANRAAELLRKSSVIAKGSPAVRIAWEVREAPCEKKLTMLDRAASEGDVRALVVLETTGGCFKHNKAVGEAELKLRQRAAAP